MRYCGYAAGGGAAMFIKLQVGKAEPFRISLAAKPREKTNIERGNARAIPNNVRQT